MKNPTQRKKMNKGAEIALVLFALYLSVMLLKYPAQCIESGTRAVNLCLNVIIPSLFPFFVCSGLFIALGVAEFAGRKLSGVMLPLFNVSGAGALAFVMGIIGGYPVGASAAIDLYRRGECSKTETERLLAFCNNAGPLFLLGSVGAGMLHSPMLGQVLYISHISAAVVVGLIFRFYRPRHKEGIVLNPSSAEKNLFSAGEMMGSVIKNAVVNLAVVCGFIIFFSVASDTLPQIFGFIEFNYIINGVIEMTGGVNKIAQSGALGEIFKMTVISFLAGFSGIAILFQVSRLAGNVGISIKTYVIGKIVQGVVSAIFTYIAMQFLITDTYVFTHNLQTIPYSEMSPFNLFVTAVMMVGWCVISVLVMVAVGCVYDFIRAKRRRSLAKRGQPKV